MLNHDNFTLPQHGLQNEQITQLPLFPTCHYCSRLVDPGLRFCDEVCQVYFDVRKTWQRDVKEFTAEQAGNDQANVFGEAIARELSVSLSTVKNDIKQLNGKMEAK